MRAVVQRVRSGSVEVNQKKIAGIENGLIILLGAGHGDSEETAKNMAQKISKLRIFNDPQGKMNLSIQDVGGAVIVVSQFTLYANTQKGNRPSFIDAAPPEIASPLVDYFVKCLGELGIATQTGIFGAEMLVSIENDGPVTILLEM